MGNGGSRSEAIAVKSANSSQPAKARVAAADVGDQVGEATKDVSELAAGAVARPGHGSREIKP